MTPETRKRIFRYGIAIDLVIVATGVAMLFPQRWLIVALFLAATAAAAWKGKAGGALLAFALSIASMVLAVPVAPLNVLLGVFVGASAVLVFLPLAWNERSAFVPAAAPVPVTDTDGPKLAPVEALDAFRESDDARRKADARAAREREEAARRAAKEEEKRRKAEARAAREREDAERRAAAEEKQRREAETAKRERELAEEKRRRDAETPSAREREEDARRAAEEEKARRLEVERRAEEDRIARERLEKELAEREAERIRLANELAAREATARELAEQAKAVREEVEREAAERERRALEAELARLAKELEEREAREQELQQRLEAERKAAEARIAAVRQEATKASKPVPQAQPQRTPPNESLFARISQWFESVGDRRTVNMVNRRVVNNGQRKPPVKKPVSRPATSIRRPRLVLVERRRATAETVMMKMRQRGVDIDIVERWVDAVDEMFRFKPDAVLIDVEHTEFELIRRTLSEQNPKMPLVFTGSSSAPPPHLRAFRWLTRPYDPDAMARVAQQAMTRPADLLAAETTAPSTPDIEAVPAPVAAETPVAASNNEYNVACFTCRTAFDAIDADWCSCLTRERTLVCTNCLTCFCKASAAYKEKFWIEAPPRLFERKAAETQRQQQSLSQNDPSSHVRRPLVLCADDDSQIQAIVKKICSNLGYGFIHASDGQAGLAIAREYRPDLILSDAFMPKLDGREMCRILKEELGPAECKMVVMTGLYTDTKYRNEALKRFGIDDYIAKPVAITDLINLLQKHLESVPDTPVQAAEVGAELNGTDEELELSSEVPVVPLKVDAEESGEEYEVACFNCQQPFNAEASEWCQCVGRDNTLVCPSCGGCFCKSPPSYKERFWIDAPPSLFERKMIGSKRSVGVRANPDRKDVKRPMILLVEDDENVQLIVKTVVTNMGYGFAVGADGQEGLRLAREYEPELILSDAFMPKLDGREMCRLLKEDPQTSQTKAIIMTGLYTDRKYRNEALSYFKVDDYVAKPLAVDDLIKLFKKHLPVGVSAVH